MGPLFIDRTYVLAFILDLKELYFNEYSVSPAEFYYVSDNLNKAFENAGIKAYVINAIDNYYYNIDGDIKLRKGFDTEQVVNELLLRLDYEQFDIMSDYLYNEDFMMNVLLDSKRQMINDVSRRYNFNNIKANRHTFKKKKYY